MSKTLPLAFLGLTSLASAQSFMSEQTLLTSTGDAQAILAADFDGDGDLDILIGDSSVAWLENLGGSTFGPRTNISSTSSTNYSIHAADFDGDGNIDVLTGWLQGSQLLLYRNKGTGKFTLPVTVGVPLGGSMATAITSADVDGDGDLDVLAAYCYNDILAWYENQGGGVFGPKTVVSYGANCPLGICAEDIDGDGNIDMLTASADGKIAWYRNNGDGQFGGLQLISQANSYARSVAAADLDGDGDIDVLSASQSDDKIAWYPNLGGGTFGPQQVLTTAANHAQTVRAADLNSDGKPDILVSGGYSTSSFVSWFKNLGGGQFGPMTPIAKVPYAVFKTAVAADVNGDGNLDVLSAAVAKKSFYLNEQYPPGWNKDCNGNGIPDNLDIASGLSKDCNGNGDLDECEIAADPSLDIDVNGVLDECSPAPLSADKYTLSTLAGGTQTFTLQSSTPNDAYWLLGTSSGPFPGTNSGSWLIPLNMDAYMLHTLLAPTAAPLSGSLGIMLPTAGVGAATATFTLPAGQYSYLIGTVLHHAYVTFDLSTGQLTFVSNAVPLVLLP